MLGVIGSRGTSALCLSLPVLLTSALFPLKLLAYPEYSMLYPGQPHLVSVLVLAILIGLAFSAIQPHGWS